MNFPYEDTVKYSNCCSARDRLSDKSGVYYSDLERCPQCLDNCVFMTQEELEREDNG